VARAINASVPLVSSWESAKSTPPEERLRSYALYFCGDVGSEPEWAELPDLGTLSPDQESRRRELFNELVALRTDALGAQETPARVGALGGWFWSFPDDSRIRIITTPSWDRLIGGIPYANPWHPNYIESLRDADRDATMELYGHIRAENPNADVRWLTADQATRNDLTGDVVILGQGDKLRQGSAEERQPVVNFLARRLELPVGTRLPEGGDPEYDSEFVVTCDEDGEPAYYPDGRKPEQEEVYRPTFLKDTETPGHPRSTRDGYPQLEYDVALIARMENELNLAATITICSGVFSRGTYGAVRALTDRNLRAKNEKFLADEFGRQDFWLLTRVPVFQADGGAETVTPDLARPFHRLRSAVHPATATTTETD
jgi:hypothetical protein